MKWSNFLNNEIQEYQETTHWFGNLLFSHIRWNNKIFFFPLHFIFDCHSWTAIWKLSKMHANIWIFKCANLIFFLYNYCFFFIMNWGKKSLNKYLFFFSNEHHKNKLLFINFEHILLFAGVKRIRHTCTFWKRPLLHN